MTGIVAAGVVLIGAALFVGLIIGLVWLAHFLFPGEPGLLVAWMVILGLTFSILAVAWNAVKKSIEERM